MFLENADSERPDQMVHFVRSYYGHEYACLFYSKYWDTEASANSVDPQHTPHNAGSLSGSTLFATDSIVRRHINQHPAGK